jgi:hypothetical protein
MIMKKKLISQIDPENVGTTSFPIFARFYFANNTGGNLFRYKDGAIPFFINFFDPDHPDILRTRAVKETGRRISQGHLFEKFYVYKISDLGSQSLSPTFDDIFVYVYDSEGRKILQKNIMIIREYTGKNAFILFPKEFIGQTNTKISVMIEPRNIRVTSFNLKDFQTNSNGVLSIYLNDNLLNNVENMRIFAVEGSNSFELSASDYFITKLKEDFPSSDSDFKTFVQEQGSYFIQAEKNFTNKNSLTEKDKILPSHKITISTGLKNLSTIRILNTYGFSNYFYNTYSFLSTNILLRNAIRDADISDVYKEEVNRKSTKLIRGYDYYINSNNEIIFNTVSGVTLSTKLEVYIKKDGERKLRIPFSTSSSGSVSFNPKKSLYDNFIANWDIDVPNSLITIFDSGRLVGDSSYSGFTNSRVYEYVIENISFTSNTTDPLTLTANSNITLLFDSSIFNEKGFNKYQPSTDPYLNSNAGNFQLNQQEVFLYDTSLNFKLDSSEPFLKNTAGKLTIQNIADPFVGLLPTVKNNYEDFQSVFESSKTKMTKTIHDNAKVQAIESQLSTLKRNFKAMFLNSSVSFTNYTGTVSAGQFMFLVLKGTPNSNFTLVYKDGSSVIKKEYNCRLDSDGRYISIPFFFNTFGNNKSTVSFEVENGIVSQYYIYR